MDFEINKSLDELVSEDQSLRHGKGHNFKRTGGGAPERENAANVEQGGGHRVASSGHRGGRYRGNDERDYKGGQANRIEDDRNGRFAERRGGHH